VVVKDDDVFWDTICSNHDRRELIRFINPDKRLGITLAATFAWMALPFFEAEYPEDDRPRKAIELCCRKLAGETIDKGEFLKLASSLYSFVLSMERSPACSAVYASYNALQSFEFPIHGACSASAFTSRILEKYNYRITDLIRSLVPLMIDYAIENQVPLFNGPGVEFDDFYGSLSEVDREKIFYNLELFGVE